MLRRIPAPLVLLGSLVVAAPAGAGNLFGEQPNTYVAPGKVFAVHLPTSWKVIDANKALEFQFMPSGPGDPVMFVRLLTVPEGADPLQVALRSIDEKLSKMPLFRLASKRRVTLAGHKAASISATYAFQGNLQFPRAVEQVFVVVGTEAFVFHFDVLETVAAHYVDQLNQFYQSFVPRPADSSSVFDTSTEAFPEVEKIPF